MYLKTRITIILVLLLFTVTCTLTPIYAATSHENAVTNLNFNLLPQDIAKNIQSTDINIFKKLKDLGGIFGRIFGFTPTAPETFHPRSVIQSLATAPQQASSGADPVNETDESLCDKTGVYGSWLPDFIETAKNTLECETNYQRSSLPEGVEPITKGR